MELQGVIVASGGLYWFTRGYRRLQRDTMGYRRLQGVRVGYNKKLGNKATHTQQKLIF